MDIIFATRNKNKLKEAKEIMKETKYNIISLNEINFNKEIIEDGKTYEENAKKKALEVSKFINKKIVLADDSGLEIDFLNKKPGVHSSRFLGENISYLEKNKKILEMLKNIKFEKRKARFVCVVYLIFPNKKLFVVKSILEGYISENIEGENGFGYDPIFYIKKLKKTMAQMLPEEKNEISHRAKALKEIKKILLKY